MNKILAAVLAVLFGVLMYCVVAAIPVVLINQDSLIGTIVGMILGLVALIAVLPIATVSAYRKLRKGKTTGEEVTETDIKDNIYVR